MNAALKPQSILDRFAGLKILVVGDPINDIYRFGHVDRVSPEAPVPVFIEDRIEERLGGAANVLNQLHALGCEAHGAWIYKQYHWTSKVRYMVGNHQLLRHDRDVECENRIPALEGFSAVIISDYAKGACTPEVCSEAILGARKGHIPLIVDPKGTDWTKYTGATVICPNEAEMKASVGNTTLYDIVLKRGARGITLMRRDGDADFPATARHVFDVTGAGDTVTAVIAACLAAGASLPDACRLANLAAGHVVSEVGTTVCSIERLRELCA